MISMLSDYANYGNSILNHFDYAAVPDKVAHYVFLMFSKKGGRVCFLWLCMFIKTFAFKKIMRNFHTIIDKSFFMPYNSTRTRCSRPSCLSTKISRGGNHAAHK